MFRSIYPFIQRLSSNDQNDFMDEFAEEINKLRPNRDVYGSITEPFTLLLIFARK